MIKLQREALCLSCSKNNDISVLEAVNIIKANTFKLDEIKNVISYLTFLMEGIVFEFESGTVAIKKDDKCHRLLNLFYLTSTETVIAAKDEIRERFGKRVIYTDSELAQKLAMPAENYVQLSFATNALANSLQNVLFGLAPSEAYSILRILKNGGASLLGQEEWCLRFEGPIDITPDKLNFCDNALNITDSRFGYIMDFLAIVTEFRLNKQDGLYQITNEEMMILAEQFASERKNNSQEAIRA